MRCKLPVVESYSQSSEKHDLIKHLQRNRDVKHCAGHPGPSDDHRTQISAALTPHFTDEETLAYGGEVVC